MVTLDLALPPSVNRLWRATKQGGVYRSPKYTNWLKSTYIEILVQMRGQKPIRGEYKLTVTCVRPDRRRHSTGCAAA